MEYSLQRLIESEIELQGVLIRLRDNLSKRFDFNVVELYSLISGDIPEKPLQDGIIMRFVQRLGETSFS